MNVVTLMGKRRVNASFKTKKKAKKKKSKRQSAKKSDQKKSKLKIENGVNDLCATLHNLGFDDSVSKKTATSSFLEKSGLSNSVDKSSKSNKKKSKKTTKRIFSMLKLISSLPKESTSSLPSGGNKTVDIEELPVKIVPSTDFKYKQQDCRKFFKRIISKERSKQRKIKDQSY